MATNGVVSDTGPDDNIVKICGKCYRKVQSAWTKCYKCEDGYHKGCLQVLPDKGKKFTVITDNIMLCEEHSRDLSTVKCCETVIGELMKENILFNRETKNLSDENSRLRENNS